MEGYCLKFLIAPISCVFIVICSKTYNITMIRLSSYLVYLPVLFIPAAIIGITTSIITNDVGPNPFFFALFLLPLSVWAYILYQSKRIYCKESELYLFSLFSKKMEVVKKDQGISIEKRSLSVFRDTGTYKLTYWITNDKVKTIWFPVNSFLDNPDEIIDKINSVD